MGVFSRHTDSEMDRGVRAAQADVRAVLVDVREPDEFASGHVPDAINVPLSGLAQITRMVPDASVPLYLYCASGARSRRAAKALADAGYQDVRNIGGMQAYTGPIER